MTANNNVELMEHRIEMLEETHSEIKIVLKELTTAVNKLIIVDERQVQAAVALDRLTKNVDKAHERIDSLERLVPETKQANQWVYEAVKALAVVAGVFVLKKSGVM